MVGFPLDEIVTVEAPLRPPEIPGTPESRATPDKADAASTVAVNEVTWDRRNRRRLGGNADASSGSNDLDDETRMRDMP